MLIYRVRECKSNLAALNQGPRPRRGYVRNTQTWCPHSGYRLSRQPILGYKWTWYQPSMDWIQKEHLTLYFYQKPRPLPKLLSPTVKRMCTCQANPQSTATCQTPTPVHWNPRLSIANSWSFLVVFLFPPCRQHWSVWNYSATVCNSLRVYNCRNVRTLK